MRYVMHVFVRCKRRADAVRLHPGIVHFHFFFGGRVANRGRIVRNEPSRLGKESPGVIDAPPARPSIFFLRKALRDAGRDRSPSRGLVAPPVHQPPPENPAVLHAFSHRENVSPGPM